MYRAPHGSSSLLLPESNPIADKSTNSPAITARRLSIDLNKSTCPARESMQTVNVWLQAWYTNVHLTLLDDGLVKDWLRGCGQTVISTRPRPQNVRGARGRAFA